MTNELKGRRALCINLGEEQEPLLEQLHNMGAELYGIHTEQRPTLSVPIADCCYVRDFHQLERMLRFAEAIKPDAIISDQCDYSQFAVSFLRANLGHSDSGILTPAYLSTNKWLQRHALQTAGIKQPPFELITSPQQAKDFAVRHTYPLIFKPVDNRGSFGVGRADDETQVEEHFFEALVHARSQLVLCEAFIEGESFSVEGYVFPKVGYQTLAIGKRRVIAGDHPVADQIEYTDQFPAQTKEALHKVQSQIAGALAIQTGHVHGEYIVRDGEVYPVEVANRGGGIYIAAQVVSAVSGIDATRQSIWDAFGERKDLYADQRCHEAKRRSVILHWHQLGEGRLRRLDGLEQAGKLPGVLRVWSLLKPNQQVPRIVSGATRHVMFIVEGLDMAQCRKRLHEAISVIKAVFD